MIIQEYNNNDQPYKLLIVTPQVILTYHAIDEFFISTILHAIIKISFMIFVFYHENIVMTTCSCYKYISLCCGYCEDFFHDYLCDLLYDHKTFYLNINSLQWHIQRVDKSLN